MQILSNNYIKKITFFLFFLTFILFNSISEPLKVIKIQPIQSTVLYQNELQTLQSMITSYIIELNEFRIIDSNGIDLSLKEIENQAMINGETKPLNIINADFIMNISINLIGDIYVFSIDMIKISTGEKISVTENCTSINDVILKARNTTLKIFNSTNIQNSITEQKKVKSITSISELVGNWKGDKGLDTIRIIRNDGTALAIVSGGIAMKLSISINQGYVYISQDQPNRPEYYMSSQIPYSTAQLIAKQARPMIWIFQISEDGKTLIGIKKSISVTLTEKGELIIDNEYTREAVWTKN